MKFNKKILFLTVMVILSILITTTVTTYASYFTEEDYDVVVIYAPPDDEIPEDNTTQTASKNQTAKDDGKPVVKITNNCNVRNNAGANNKFLGKVKKGQTYFVLEQKKAPNGKIWYKVNYKKSNGWICSSFCTLTQGKLPDLKKDDKKDDTDDNSDDSYNNPNKPDNKDDKGNKHGKLIGTFKATAYCACEGGGENYYTADGFCLKGKSRTDAMTIAVDKSIIPLGTKVYIEFPSPYEHFNGYYTAHDTGGAIKGYKIDLYMDTNNVKEMNKFGVRKGLKIYYAG